MGFLKDINARTKLITVTVTGQVGYEQFRRTFDEILEDDNFETGMDILWDLNAADISITSGDVHRMVLHIDSKREQRGWDYKTAIVAAQTPELAISRVFKVLADSLPFETRVFETIEEARSWIETFR